MSISKISVPGFWDTEYTGAAATVSHNIKSKLSERISSHTNHGSINRNWASISTSHVIIWLHLFSADNKLTLLFFLHMMSEQENLSNVIDWVKQDLRDYLLDTLEWLRISTNKIWKSRTQCH